MMEFIGTTPEGWGFLCQKFMSGRCYTLLWMIQGGEGGKEKTEDWGRPGLLLKSRDAQPPYKVG